VGKGRHIDQVPYVCRPHKTRKINPRQTTSVRLKKAVKATGGAKEQQNNRITRGRRDGEFANPFLRKGKEP